MLERWVEQWRCGEVVWAASRHDEVLESWKGGEQVRAAPPVERAEPRAVRFGEEMQVAQSRAKLREELCGPAVAHQQREANELWHIPMRDDVLLEFVHRSEVDGQLGERCKRKIG